LNVLHWLLPLTVAAPVFAQGLSAASAPGRAVSAAAAAAGPLAIGEVLEIDRKGKRVLLKHGPIASIGMDAMTMEFAVPDGRLLDTLRPGDKVRFAVVWRKGDYEITRIEVANRKGSKR